MLYILEGRVRHEYGEGLKQIVENTAGDFIFIERIPEHPRKGEECSIGGGSTALGARSGRRCPSRGASGSDASEWQNIISYQR